MREGPVRADPPGDPPTMPGCRRRVLQQAFQTRAARCAEPAAVGDGAGVPRGRGEAGEVRSPGLRRRPDPHPPCGHRRERGSPQRRPRPADGPPPSQSPCRKRGSHPARVSIGQGAIQVGATGFVAPAVVTVCRLLNSDELRAALAASPGNDAAFIVMADLYHDMFAQGYGGLPAQGFSPVHVSQPAKGFAADAWIQVPGRLPAVAAIPGLSRRHRAPAPAAERWRTAGPRCRRRRGMGALRRKPGRARRFQPRGDHRAEHHAPDHGTADHSAADHNVGDHAAPDHDIGDHGTSDHGEPGHLGPDHLHGHSGADDPFGDGRAGDASGYDASDYSASDYSDAGGYDAFDYAGADDLSADATHYGTY